jgi:hypothetical protein
METTLMYVFDDLATAERVRDELLSRGFEREQVKLRSREDEAGPVRSNFTVGNPPELEGGDDYQETYANPRQRGTCMLTIAPVDPTQRQYAIALLARYGVDEAALPPNAIEVEQRDARPRPAS